MILLRALLVGLLLALGAGTPGLGLETRTSTSTLVGALYAIPFLAAIGALVCTWRWRRALRWLGWIAAVSAVVLSALDLLGVMDPVRPPAGVAVAEVAAIALSLAIAFVLRTRANVATRG